MTQLSSTTVPKDRTAQIADSEPAPPVKAAEKLGARRASAPVAATGTRARRRLR